MTTTRIYPRIDSVPLSVSAPAGGATEAKQDTQITALGTIHTDLNTTIHGDLVTLNAKVPVLGQAAMAASAPVTIANNQTALPVKTQDGAGNALTSQVNGSARALDVGVNVAGVQVDPRSIRALTSSDVVTAYIKDGAGTSIVLGQTAMATSVPVTIANNQAAFPVTPATLTVVDQIDTTPLLDLSSSNIPASASSSLALVASLAAAVKKVVTVEDIGEFFGLYSGVVSSPTLLCVLPLGGGEMDISIPPGTLVSIRNMKNAAVTSGFLAINFLG